jgi:hypothetical protein
MVGFEVFAVDTSLINIQNAQVSDTTGDAMKTSAGNKKNKTQNN